MDLSGILAFNITFDTTGVPKLVVEDVTDYAGSGVNPADISGYVRITNPDGFTVGSAVGGTPSITYSGGQFNSYEQNLRKDYRNRTQLGMYTVKYTVVYPQGGGELTLSYQFLYERKSHVITKSFDVFTPSLSLTDNTNYDYGGYTETVTRAWSVTATPLLSPITGTAQSIDLGDGGVYYDSVYSATLVTDIELQDVTYAWAKVVDRITTAGTYGAQRPLSCSELEDQLTIYRTELTQHFGVNNVTFQRLRQEYEYLASLMFHIQQRALAADFTGLETYIDDWTNVSRFYNPDNYTYLDTAISGYVWDCNAGGGGGPTDWTQILNKPTTFTPSAHRHPSLRVDLPALTTTYQVVHNWGFIPGVQVYENIAGVLHAITCDIQHDSNNAFTITLTQQSPNPLSIIVINDENI